MTPTSLVAALAPRTGKINEKMVFERGGNLLQNGILHFVELAVINLQSK